MPPTNADVLRRALDHFSETGAPLLELYDPEIVFVTRSELGHSTYEGLDGLQRVIRSFREVWGDSTRGEILEVVDGGDVLVLLIRFQIRGVTSGAELTADEGWACWMRDGRIARIEQYGSKAQALEAAELKG